jgi:hypothetical protein
VTLNQIKKLKLENDQAVAVVWEDITTESGWHEKEEDFSPTLVKTLGFYGGIVKNCVLAKHSFSSHPSMAPSFDGTVVPIGAILRIKKLQVEK